MRSIFKWSKTCFQQTDIIFIDAWHTPNNLRFGIDAEKEAVERIMVRRAQRNSISPVVGATFCHAPNMRRFQQLWVANVTYRALMSVLGHDMKSELLLSHTNHHGRGFAIWLLFEFGNGSLAVAALE